MSQADAAQILKTHALRRSLTERREVDLSPKSSMLMIKPVGAACNLRCHYCYYLPVMGIYDGNAQRMREETLEATLAGYLPESNKTVTLSWQGGEPTLAGLDWFKRMIELVDKHRRPDQRVVHCLQTNGTLLDDEWCAFLRQHEFLIGISLDGLASDHNHYRVTTDGSGSYAQVMRGLELLRKHGVEHNILMVLNNKNVVHPKEVWRELMRIEARWVQFIPAVEWLSPDDAERVNRHDGDWHAAPADLGDWKGWHTASFSPTPEQYGRFLCEVFDLWFEKHRYEVSVRFFDSVLNTLVMGRASECIYSHSCAGQVTIEHDGTVFGCDHYVQPEWRLGHVHGGAARTVPLTINSSVPEQERESAPIGGRWMSGLDRARATEFADRKLDLGEPCASCDWFQLCHGGCPKHRPARGELPGPTVLCDGYRTFYPHAMPRLQWIANFLKQGQMPPEQVPAELLPSTKKTAPRKQRKKRK
ncbi:radical SAM protein [Mucisphaera calidilacus]|uniref:Anaerobic sulfatase-maturating enzyme n=1 Tax=Mucisphaera calidilacus TaxID=2527982 RepID=A0A518BVA8_9BACT|nr:radical SAM protein [Mucisphaera calidilacus]QDU70920.1 Anaerobic sulfatase-maturating enzyme [Mucisphaera calidilacus]